MIHFLTLLLLLLPSMVQAEAHPPLRVAVAANFINVMEVIVPSFTATAGISIQSVYGSTGKLYAQIKNGAPYDLFLAADHDRPKLLHEAGICEEPFVYGFGSVVLWSWDKEIKGDSWQELLKSNSGKIAIANPATAPYGGKALKAIQEAGLEESISSRFVYGQSVGQTFVFVQTGNASFGFIALSHALSELGRKGHYWPIPEAERVDQWGCINKNSENQEAVQQFISYFTSDDGKALFHSLGYQQ